MSVSSCVGDALISAIVVRKFLISSLAWALGRAYPGNSNSFAVSKQNGVHDGIQPNVSYWPQESSRLSKPMAKWILVVTLQK